MNTWNSLKLIYIDSFHDCFWLECSCGWCVCNASLESYRQHCKSTPHHHKIQRNSTELSANDNIIKFVDAKLTMLDNFKLNFCFPISSVNVSMAAYEPSSGCTIYQCSHCLWCYSVKNNDLNQFFFNHKRTCPPSVFEKFTGRAISMGKKLRPITTTYDEFAKHVVDKCQKKQPQIEHSSTTNRKRELLDDETSKAKKIKSADLFEKIGSHCVIPIAIEKKVDWTKTPQVPHHKYFIDKFQESLLTLSWFHNVHFDDNKTCQNVILMSSTIPKHKYIIKKIEQMKAWWNISQECILECDLPDRADVKNFGVGRGKQPPSHNTSLTISSLADLRSSSSTQLIKCLWTEATSREYLRDLKRFLTVIENEYPDIKSNFLQIAQENAAADDQYKENSFHAHWMQYALMYVVTCDESAEIFKQYLRSISLTNAAMYANAQAQNDVDGAEDCEAF